MIVDGAVGCPSGWVHAICLRVICPVDALISPVAAVRDVTLFACYSTKEAYI